jgi:membrane protein involved in colicin uptake
MKIQHTILISALVLGSGAAMAAGNGGGGQASDSAVTAASGSMSSSTTKHTKMKSTHTATKPANDTTNMPGADAASDTKGN